MKHTPSSGIATSEANGTASKKRAFMSEDDRRLFWARMCADDANRKTQEIAVGRTLIDKGSLLANKMSAYRRSLKTKFVAMEIHRAGGDHWLVVLSDVENRVPSALAAVKKMRRTLTAQRFAVAP